MMCPPQNYHRKRDGVKDSGVSGMRVEPEMWRNAVANRGQTSKSLRPQRRWSGEEGGGMNLTAMRGLGGRLYTDSSLAFSCSNALKMYGFISWIMFVVVWPVGDRGGGLRRRRSQAQAQAVARLVGAT